MVPIEVVIDRLVLTSGAQPSTVGMVAFLLARVFGPTLGGDVAATIDRKTPVPAAVVSGVAIGALGLAAALRWPGMVPLWLHLVQTVLAVAATSFGGALRVATRRPRHAGT